MKESKLQGYSNFRSFGNRIYNFIFSLVCMRIIFDLGSGLNLYRLSKLKNYYYKKFPDDLTFNYVMLLYSYHFNHKVGFFPISWREDDQISNVRLFKQALKVLKLLINFAFTRKNFFKKDFRKINYENYGYTDVLQ